MAELPERARIVIIGGGVIGTSVAYHLATAGCRDVLLLEQGQLSWGTPRHAGVLGCQLRASERGPRVDPFSRVVSSRLAGRRALAATVLPSASALLPPPTAPLVP